MAIVFKTSSSHWNTSDEKHIFVCLQSNLANYVSEPSFSKFDSHKVKSILIAKFSHF